MLGETFRHASSESRSSSYAVEKVSTKVQSESNSQNQNYNCDSKLEHELTTKQVLCYNFFVFFFARHVTPSKLKLHYAI